ncbi:MAG: GGDEF domain-containing protein [Candidatus Competibacteraceae bacterium]|nr:GGDEF domain-containing protein [Candidatus Competibacteraceae bacterium]
MIDVFAEMTRLPLFAGLSEVQRRELAEQRLLYLDTGQILKRRGENNTQLFVLLSGSLQVLLASRPESPLNIIEPGQCVGEVSMIDGRSVTIDVVADQPSCLLPIAQKTFWTLMHDSPSWCCQIVKLLAARLRNSNDMLHQYEQHASFDLLTGLFNRRWLMGNLTRLLTRCQLSGQPFTVLMVDIDHFKRFNDTFGHPAGDQALSAVATCLKDQVRPDDPVVRYGGEEMTILLSDLDREQGYQTAERLRRAVAGLTVQLEQGQQLPPLTVSVGGAQAQKDEVNGDRVLARADAALYRAKRQGRNQVVFD